MKITALVSALALGVSTIALPAFAQTEGEQTVPGNTDALTEEVDRNDVASESEPNTTAENPAAGNASRTRVPGNTDAAEDDVEAQTRQSIAEGTAANQGSNPQAGETTDEVVPGEVEDE